MASNSTSVDCVPGAVPGGLVRTSFFNGMFLTQSDLEIEQRFWRMKRRLTNRALGAGVVWGLRATFDGQTQRFTVNPGYGLDCCGNDLVVQAAFETKAGALLDVTDPAVQALLGNQNGQNEVALILEYAECPEEPRPVHKDACTPEGDACHTARVRETVKLSVAAPPKPPRGPIADFVDGVNDLRNQIGKQQKGVSGDVFPETAGKMGFGQTTEFPFSLRIRLGGDDKLLDATNSFDAINNSSGVPDAKLEQTFNYTQADVDSRKTVDLHFELVPSPGWVFYEGKVDFTSRDATGGPFRLEPPFDVHFAWSYQIPLPDQPPTGEQTMQSAAREIAVDFTVENLGVARLFEAGAPRMKVTPFRVVANLGITAEKVVNGNAAPSAVAHCCATQIKFAALDLGNEQQGTIEIDTDGTLWGAGCLNPLMFGPFMPQGDTMDPVAGPKTVVLAALYAWLTNAFHPDMGIPQQNPVPPANFNGQRIVASWIYLTAWRILFGANAASSASPAAREALAELLDQLMVSWCEGFFYSGPRCPADFHGIVLGTAIVNNTGLVQSFDMWQNRRWVLTGPLLTHWGMQLGFAPIDVTASRLVRTICCLGLSQKASMALPPLPEAEAAAWRSQAIDVVNNEQNLQFAYDTQNVMAHAGTMLSDSCYMLFGVPLETEVMLAKHGVVPKRTAYLRWNQFVGKMIDGMMRRDPPKAHVAWVRYLVDGMSNDGAQPQLLLAADAHEQSAHQETRTKAKDHLKKALEVFRAVLAAKAIHNNQTPQFVPPLAFDPLIDMLTEASFDLPVAVLEGALATAVAQPAAYTAGFFSLLRDLTPPVITVADALALGAEGMADAIFKLVAKPDFDLAVMHLFRLIINPDHPDDDSLLGCIAAAIGGSAQDWQTNPWNKPFPFRRKDLADSGLIDLIMKVIRGTDDNGAPIHPTVPLNTNAIDRSIIECAAGRAGGFVQP